MKANNHKSNSRKHATTTSVIDSDGHVRETDAQIQDFRVPDWHEWAGKLDEGNIDLTVLYPTRFMHIGQIGNPAYAVELCHAYNNYLYEQFLTQDRRFRGMALLPLQDVTAAVKELRRSVTKQGMVGGIGGDARPEQATPPGIVEGLHPCRVSGEGLRRRHVLDPHRGPDAVGIAEGVQPGFARDAGAGQDHDRAAGRHPYSPISGYSASAR